jgi:hypothetical protein
MDGSNRSTDAWLRWLQSEEERKAHLNGAANSNLPPLNERGVKPPVWGGWGQQRPRVALPPALGRLGFPFTPPPPPPPDEREQRAMEFRRTVAGMRGISGDGREN